MLFRSVRLSESGVSLARIDLGVFGNNALNWAYRLPSPGRIQVGESPNPVSDPAPRIRLTNEGFELRVMSSPNRIYRVQYAASIASPDWTDLQVLSGRDGDVVVIDPVFTRSARFYRVLVE